MKFKKLKLLKQKRVDLDSTSSKLSGLPGLFEKSLRKFKTLVHLLAMAPIYLLASVCMGISAWPSIRLFRVISQSVEGHSSGIQALGYGVSLAAGYFIYGFCLLFVTSFMNWVLRTNLRSWRGPYYSFQSLAWYIHNGLVYIVRFTFLEFVTPTPFNLLFYKMMGMKIGKGTQINTVHISDPSLIELGNKVTVGGSVTIVGHYGASGFLILSPVKIGDGVTIGLRAIIMADVHVGNGARILPNSVVMPKSRIGEGEVWGGVPAQKIAIKKAA